MHRTFLFLLAAGIGFSFLTLPCRAEEQEENPIRKIVLHPAAEPRPALRYQFVFPVGERRTANAALLYDRISAAATFKTEDKVWDEFEEWSKTPLDELRSEKTHAAFEKYSWIADLLREAARCNSCDWQFIIPGKNVFETIIPEAQQSRYFVRILAPFARLKMAEGKYDDAVDFFRSGYLLARNVGNEPFLICCLVGSAIAMKINEQVEQFIQLPDAPNLYWALSTMPTPLIDYRVAWESEMDLLYCFFPEWRNLDKKELSPEQWRHLLNQMTTKYTQYFGDKSDLETTARIIEGYPRAKRYLIDRGRSAADVEAMPVPQVIMLYTVQICEELRDEAFKWAYLPYAEARKKMEESDQRLREAERSRREIFPLTSQFLPAALAAKTADVRTKRDIAALRVLEALRLYGAGHGGKLPDRLADVTEVPVPDDPFTGQPFIYHREGPTAFLDSFGPRPNLTLRYQIEMRPKGEKP
ncbi:MAG: hypothetical protein JXB10_09750 [Pirellulales bacterium]|nr:hypothetical protein [Pirellulales bacterium]